MMKQEIIFSFLKRAYFGSVRDGVDEYSLASNRAYRDFCRTIDFHDKPAPKAGKKAIESFVQKKSELRNAVTNLFRQGLTSNLGAKNYDEWHEKTCDSIIVIYSEKGVTLSYGQAQKWLNMFMKYLCVLSPELVDPYLKELHVPFDNIVIDMAVEMGAFDRPLNRWSVWTKKEYLNYHTKLNKKISEKSPNIIPIVWEFINWKGNIGESE